MANLLKAVLLIFVMSIASGAGAEPSDYELRLKALEEKMEAGSKTREWLDKFSFKNDLRLRHESRFLDKDAAGNNVLDQHRQRFRLRLGGEYNFDSNLKVGLRLATGSTDPISTNQTMADAFGKKAINVDWAYAHYARSFGALKTWFTGGKFDEPFFRASQLLWDYDLTAEGLTESFAFPLRSSTTLFATFGQFAVDESAAQQYDPYLIGYQGGVEQTLGPLGKVKAAAAYYDYANVKGKVIPHRKSTNTLSGGGLANDFDIISAAATWTVDMGVPFTVLGEYA
ncbi:MAG: putative porin, partial [Nitrospinae bacterium]|nr:putative porin [Nitrospinota bacterium]